MKQVAKNCFSSLWLMKYITSPFQHVWDLGSKRRHYLGCGELNDSMHVSNTTVDMVGHHNRSKRASYFPIRRPALLRSEHRDWNNSVQAHTCLHPERDFCPKMNRHFMHLDTDSFIQRFYQMRGQWKISRKYKERHNMTRATVTGCHQCAIMFMHAGIGHLYISYSR